MLSLACSADSLSPKIDGDGKSDQSAAIQNALNQCAATGGGTVMLPTGSFRLDKPITVPTGVTLAGQWEAPHRAELHKGTVILAYAGKGSENDPPLVKLSSSSAVKGLTIFYPEQRLPDAVPYPWTIQGEGIHCSVLDTTLVNPYKGIDFGTFSNELHHIRNVYGCPLKVGVFIDKCTDIGRVENVHFNPNYWTQAEAPGVPSGGQIAAYLWNNCTAFDIARSDWEAFVDTFAWGCKYGYHFHANKDGACNGSFLGIGADWAQIAVFVEETQAPGLLITNGEFVGGDGSQTMVEVARTHTGAVQFSNCSFWGPAERVARIAGKGSVSMCQCNINWLKVPPGAALIEAGGGDLIVQSCRFTSGTSQVRLNRGLKTAVIMGNVMFGPISIENKSSADVQIIGNVTRSK
jgi:hypothetical protein